MNIKLLLCGDVMTGRGIDQILPNPSNPEIFEPYIKDAREYVNLAEKANGKINYPVSFEYIWGDALVGVEKLRPDFRIVNLETTISTSKDYLPKGINYRMNPQNVRVLKAFKIDACLLANNHILDWGESGLVETLQVLRENGMKPVGAGESIEKAKEPIVLPKGGKKVVVFSYAHPSSGVPLDWQAGKNKAGVNLIRDFSQKELLGVKDYISEKVKEGDFVIFSIHTGSNWGYGVDPSFKKFVYKLIEETKVDLVFGHSSHHFKGIEKYQGKFIIYGAGDFINDYEGISGYGEFRGDLVLMYFFEIDPDGKRFESLTLLPMKIKNFRLNNPEKEDVDWIYETLKERSNLGSGKLRISNGKILGID